MKQLWEYSVEELAERCALAEFEIERLRAYITECDEHAAAERDALLAALTEIARKIHLDQPLNVPAPPPPKREGK